MKVLVILGFARGREALESARERSSIVNDFYALWRIREVGNLICGTWRITQEIMTSSTSQLPLSGHPQLRRPHICDSSR